MDNMKLVEKEINRIEDKDIKEFTVYFLSKASEEFWTSPSSSSGKYHPLEDNNENGLIRHTIKAFYIAEDLCRFYNIKDTYIDICRSACLLHDIMKNGIKWEDKTDYTHGLLAFNYMNNDEYIYVMAENIYKTKIDPILLAVRWHMSRWCSPEDENMTMGLYMSSIGSNYITNTIIEIVQLSDYMASRKNISFLPDIELNQNQIDSFMRDRT